MKKKQEKHTLEHPGRASEATSSEGASATQDQADEQDSTSAALDSERATGAASSHKESDGESVTSESTKTPSGAKAAEQGAGHREAPAVEQSARSKSPEVWRNSPPIGLRQWWGMPSLTGDGQDDRNVQFGVLFVSILIYMTQLGFGLWDCWEPHYAETARMMIVRNDWVHPFWSYAYLLSKPILMFWYMAASMSVFGVSEWAIRLPFALHAVMLIWIVYFVTSRLFNQRAGLLAALVVGTAPLTTFLGRQALADILVATYMTAALGFFALALFGNRTIREKATDNGFEVPVHLPYLYFAYAMLGLGMLAKGLLGPGLPVIVVAGYLLMSWDWKIVLRARLISGSLLMCAIGLPWYLHMITFPGRNIDDGHTFLKRFLLNDNVKRLFAGVHGDRGHFIYFIKQFGYACGLWIGFVPIALAGVARFRNPVPDAHERLYRFLFSWWVFIFLFFSFSQTKFHHYIYPLIPISAILIGLWLDRYMNNETNERALVDRFAILLALGIFGLVIRDVIFDPKHLVNMFVYMYSRPYPTTDPMWLGGRIWEFNLPFFRGVFRPTPQTLFSLFASVVAAFMLSGYFYNARRYLVQGLTGVALVWTVYHAHVFMIKLTPHWSQEPLFSYLKKDSPWWQKKLSQKLSNALVEPVPPEPLIAFKMNWRGEKFYSGNRDLQVMKEFSYTRLFDTIKRHQKPLRPVYFLIEIGRLKSLEKGVGTYNARRLRIPDLSPRYRGQGKTRVQIDPTQTKKVRWITPSSRAISWFKRYHNKYLLLKMLPRPASERQTAWQIKSDHRKRVHDDQFQQRWYYDKVGKQWRKRRWWIAEEKRRKQRKEQAARQKRQLQEKHQLRQLRQKRLLQQRQRQLLQRHPLRHRTIQPPARGWRRPLLPVLRPSASQPMSPTSAPTRARYPVLRSTPALQR